MPAKYDLALYRGDTYERTFLLWADSGKTQRVDLTGATARAEIRDVPGGTRVTALDCTIPGPVDGQVVIRLDADDYANVPAAGVWDLELTYADTTVQTIVAGKAVTTADVTGSVPLARRGAA